MAPGKGKGSGGSKRDDPPESATDSDAKRAKVTPKPTAPTPTPKLQPKPSAKTTPSKSTLPTEHPTRRSGRRSGVQPQFGRFDLEKASAGLLRVVEEQQPFEMDVGEEDVKPAIKLDLVQAERIQSLLNEVRAGGDARALIDSISNLQPAIPPESDPVLNDPDQRTRFIRLANHVIENSDWYQQNRTLFSLNLDDDPDAEYRLSTTNPAFKCTTVDNIKHHGCPPEERGSYKPEKSILRFLVDQQGQPLFKGSYKEQLKEQFSFTALLRDAFKPLAIVDANNKADQRANPAYEDLVKIIHQRFSLTREWSRFAIDEVLRRQVFVFVRDDLSRSGLDRARATQRGRQRDAHLQYEQLVREGKEPVELSYLLDPSMVKPEPGSDLKPHLPTRLLTAKAGSRAANFRHHLGEFPDTAEHVTQAEAFQVLATPAQDLIDSIKANDVQSVRVERTFYCGRFERDGPYAEVPEGLIPMDEQQQEVYKMGHNAGVDPLIIAELITSIMPHTLDERNQLFRQRHSEWDKHKDRKRLRDQDKEQYMLWAHDFVRKTCEGFLVPHNCPFPELDFKIEIGSFVHTALMVYTQNDEFLLTLSGDQVDERIDAARRDPRRFVDLTVLLSALYDEDVVWAVEELGGGNQRPVPVTRSELDADPSRYTLDPSPDVDRPLEPYVEVRVKCVGGVPANESQVLTMASVARRLKKGGPMSNIGDVLRWFRYSGRPNRVIDTLVAWARQRGVDLRVPDFTNSPSTAHWQDDCYDFEYRVLQLCALVKEHPGDDAAETRRTLHSLSMADLKEYAEKGLKWALKAYPEIRFTSVLEGGNTVENRAQRFIAKMCGEKAKADLILEEDDDEDDIIASQGLPSMSQDSGTLAAQRFQRINVTGPIPLKASAAVSKSALKVMMFHRRQRKAEGFKIVDKVRARHFEDDSTSLEADETSMGEVFAGEWEEVEERMREWVTGEMRGEWDKFIDDGYELELRTSTLEDAFHDGSARIVPPSQQVPIPGEDEIEGMMITRSKVDKGGEPIPELVKEIIKETGFLEIPDKGRAGGLIKEAEMRLDKFFIGSATMSSSIEKIHRQLNDLLIPVPQDYNNAARTTWEMYRLMHFARVFAVPLINRALWCEDLSMFREMNNLLEETLGFRVKQCARDGWLNLNSGEMTASLAFPKGVEREDDVEAPKFNVSRINKAGKAAPDNLAVVPVIKKEGVEDPEPLYDFFSVEGDDSPADRARAQKELDDYEAEPTLDRDAEMGDDVASEVSDEYQDDDEDIPDDLIGDGTAINRNDIWALEPVAIQMGLTPIHLTMFAGGATVQDEVAVSKPRRQVKSISLVEAVGLFSGIKLDANAQITFFTGSGISELLRIPSYETQLMEARDDLKAVFTQVVSPAGLVVESDFNSLFNRWVEDYHRRVRIESTNNFDSDASFHHLLGQAFSKGQLKRVYTLNVDEVETKAGLELIQVKGVTLPGSGADDEGVLYTEGQVLPFHGSVNVARCDVCEQVKRTGKDEIKSWQKGRPVTCDVCQRAVPAEETKTEGSGGASMKTRSQRQLGHLRPSIVLPEEKPPHNMLEIGHILTDLDFADNPPALVVVAGTPVKGESWVSLVNNYCRRVRQLGGVVLYVDRRALPTWHPCRGAFDFQFEGDLGAFAVAVSAQMEWGAEE